MGHAVSQGGTDVDEDLCVAPHLPNVHPETVDVADDRERRVAIAAKVPRKHQQRRRVVLRARERGSQACANPGKSNARASLSWLVYCFDCFKIGSSSSEVPRLMIKRPHGEVEKFGRFQAGSRSFGARAAARGRRVSMRSLSRSHSERAGDAHEMQASLIATKRELNTARIELSRGRVEIARLETLVKKQQQQLDALLGDGDGPTRHELEKNLAVRRVTEKAISDREALKQVISAREAEVRARDATIAELRQSQAATTLEEINRANEEYYAEVCRLRRALGARGPVGADGHALGARGPVGADGHDSAVREAMQLAATDDTIRMAAASEAVQRRMRVAAENEALRAAGPLPADAGRDSAVLRQAMSLANADETVRQAMSIAAQNEALRSMLDTSASEGNREPRVARARTPPQQEDPFERRINLPNGGVTDPTKWPPPNLRLASRAPGSIERPTRGSKLGNEDGASSVPPKLRKRRPRSASVSRPDDALAFPEVPPPQSTGSREGKSRAADFAPQARAPRQVGTRKSHVQKLYDACKRESLWYVGATPPADTPEAEVGEIYRKVRARALGAAGASVSPVTATADEDDDGHVKSDRAMFERPRAGGAEEGEPASDPARATEEEILAAFAIGFVGQVLEKATVGRGAWRASLMYSCV